MSATRYVVIFRKWVSKGGSGRWSTSIGVMDERESNRAEARMRAADSTVIGVYEVDAAASKDEAIGVTAEWLARGRPRDMAVREVLA